MDRYRISFSFSSKISGITLLIFLLCHMTSRGQTDTAYFRDLDRRLNTHYGAGEYSQALQTLREMEDFAQIHFSPDTILWGNLNRAYTHVFFDLNQVDSAIHHGQKALSQHRRILGPEARSTIDVQYDLAFVFNKDFQFDSALFHYQASIELYERVLGDTTDDLPLAHHNLAVLYNDFNLYAQAITHEKKAYDIWLRLYGPDHHRIYSASSQLSSLYLNEGKPEPALLYQQQAVRIAKEIFQDQPDQIVREYLELSDIYREYGQADQRLAYLQLATDLLATQTKPSRAVQASLYHSWGKYYQEKEDFDPAEKWLRQAIDILQPELARTIIQIQAGDYHTTYGQVLKQSGQYAASLSSLSQALSYYEVFPQRSFFVYFERAENYFLLGDTTAFMGEIRALLGYFMQEPDARNLPLAKLLEQKILLYPNVNSLKVLTRSANRFVELYQQTHQTCYLNLAIQFFERLDEWYGPYLEEAHRLTPIEAALRGDIYQGLLRVYAETYQHSQDPVALEKAFAASERNKAFSLLRHLRQRSLVDYMGIPDSLVQQESQMRAQMAFLSAQMSRSLVAGEELGRRKAYQEERLSLHEKYEDFRTHLRNHYPTYYSLMDQEPVLLGDLQQTLRAGQHCLVYARVDSVLYGFHLDSRSVSLHQQVLPTGLSEEIETFRHLLFDFSAGRSASHRDSLSSLRHKFYQNLFVPFLPEQEEIEALIIVPDDVLSFLPFEVLAPEVQPLSYLLDRYPLSYAYSASLYQKQVQAKPVAYSKKLVAIAPSYQQDLLASLDASEARQIRGLVREGWYDLKGAQQEAASIVSAFEGDLISGMAASKDTFLQIASRYQILHLAMHASVKPQNPLLSSLVFSGAEFAIDDSLSQFLFATDLLGMNLNADLVVLSACNTGYGKIETGEGPESLAKAFHYAGSPAVVMSLWKVPDQETRIIMEAFYGYLKAGLSKTEALQQAKIDYLAQVKSPELAHPFFWAGFVLSGNVDPLKTETSPGQVLLVSALLVLLLFPVLYLLYRRRRSASQALKRPDSEGKLKI